MCGQWFAMNSSLLMVYKFLHHQGKVHTIPVVKVIVRELEDISADERNISGTPFKGSRLLAVRSETGGETALL